MGRTGSHGLFRFRQHVRLDVANASPRDCLPKRKLAHGRQLFGPRVCALLQRNKGACFSLKIAKEVAAATGHGCKLGPSWTEGWPR